MLRLLITLAAATLTPQQQEGLCLSFADLGVATIEAREAGVPLQDILDHIRSLDDGSDAAAIFVPIFRNGVLQAYSEHPVGLAKMSEEDRRKLASRFMAECLMDFARAGDD